jgi:hypothetical protein
MTQTAPPYSDASVPVTVDLDRTPLLSVRVSSVSRLWCVKVNSGRDKTDTYIFSPRADTGGFVADIGKLTGWTGTKTFNVILQSVTDPGGTVVLDDLRFLARDAEKTPWLKSKTSTWAPDRLVTKAAGKDPAVEVEATTAMPDVDTVAQALRMVKAEVQTLVLTGESFGGEIAWDAGRRRITLGSHGFRVEIAVSRSARWLGVSSGVWALAFDGVQTGNEIIVTARFIPNRDTAGATAAPVRAPVTTAAFHDALDKSEAAWNKRLAGVPRPFGWKLTALAPRGATPEGIRRTYYTAWAFHFNNILAARPEAGYPYLQLPTGKLSLWREGAPHARQSAQWESMWAMQTVALVGPDTAWSAFEGLMSLVRPDGVLEGEGLPAVHAQTAWVLYGLSGDRPRLEKAYSAIKRLLQWKAGEPRWIYHDSTPEGLKDATFVESALRDMGFAEKIAGVLGKPDEAADWKKQADALAADWRRWFTGPKKDVVYSRYLAGSGKRENPDALDNAAQLGRPASLLTQEQLARVMKTFRSKWSEDTGFLSIGLAAYPTYRAVSRRMWNLGLASEVAQLAEAGMRDIHLAGKFSENYSQGIPPKPVGVWPSQNGASYIIDAALLHNGVMIGEGSPVIVHVPGAVGVEGLRLRGGLVRVQFGPTGDQVALEGPGLNGLKVPAGFQAKPAADGIPRWTGTLPVGKQIALGSAS